MKFIPTNANDCRLHSITSERIGNPEKKAAFKCVHEYKIASARKYLDDLWMHNLAAGYSFLLQGYWRADAVLE
jgi:hypothetical protein